MEWSGLTGLCSAELCPPVSVQLEYLPLVPLQKCRGLSPRTPLLSSPASRSLDVGTWSPPVVGLHTDSVSRDRQSAQGGLRLRVM